MPLALKLLESAKRYNPERLEGNTCCFDYVQLKRSSVDHIPFFTLIDRVARRKGLNPIYARISRYNPGDHCNPHKDTIPDAQFAVVVHLYSDRGQLLIHYANESVLAEPTPDKPIIFKPNILHEVIPTLEGESRVVINFWLVPKGEL